MEITIKQLANQLGVSKTTISKAIFTLGLQNNIVRSGNKYVLSEPFEREIHFPKEV